MRVAFRTDASLDIGTGHVMRCLTLAESLRAKGAACQFITRLLPGHLADRIAARGFAVTRLETPQGPAPAGPPAHAAWAGVDWALDAAQTRAALAAAPADWLVLDHYAFDRRWQQVACQDGTMLMVIDDLADRPHRADLLLDQNLGRVAADYDGLVPAGCERLIGPGFALLRPEFAARRPAALAGRAARGGRLAHILISMGGVDLPNATGAVLAALTAVPLPPEVEVTVVMGAAAPGLDRVQAQAARFARRCTVQVDVADMAGLMARADLAIGGAGGTAWERCCLGLPSLIVTLAENQIGAAKHLHDRGVAAALGDISNGDLAQALQRQWPRIILPNMLLVMAAACEAITDGSGTALVADALVRP